MRRYETVVIIDPDVIEDNRKTLFDRIKEIITKQEGLLVALHEWGVQRMAYEIKRKNRGFYILIDYCGMGSLVQELERFFRIDDRVLKYMTIILKKQADMEAIQQEINALTSKADTSDTSKDSYQETAQAEFSDAADASDSDAGDQISESSDDNNDNDMTESGSDDKGGDDDKKEG